MRPALMTKDGLIGVLEDMLARVRADDSLEGSIEYLLPFPDPCEECGGRGYVQKARHPGEANPPCPVCNGTGMGPDPEGDFMVRASYRIGNLEGQGGVRMIGEMGVDA